MPRKKDRDDFHFQGFTFPNTTPVPDEFFDVLAPHLGEAELRVLLYIIRRTFGFKKQSDNISISQLCKGIKKQDGTILDEGTGLSKPAVTRAVKSLVKKHVVVATRRRSPERGDEPTTYSLNILVPYPVLTKLTRGGKPSLQGGVNQVNTQQTVLQQTDVVVIDKLKELKIEEKKAQELVVRFSSEYIERKIEFLEWKLDPGAKTRGRPIEDPAGWLIRAIEKDYKPAPGFKTKVEREKEAEELGRQEAEREKRRQEFRAQQEQERAQRVKELKREYGTTQRELDVWPQVLEQIELQTTKATYQAWFPRTQLLALKDTVAVIGVPNEVTRDWIENRLKNVIQRTLVGFGYQVELEFEVIQKSDSGS